MIKKQQPQFTSSSEIQSAIVADQLNRRGAWNKTISVPLPNFGDNRKVFVKVIEKDIAELQQYQALYQQQPLSHVHLQQSQQQQQLGQQHFQQQQQLNQHHFQQQQQLNQQQFQQQQQCQQQCHQQQQQCQQGQRVFGQNLMDNVYVNLFDNMSPMQRPMGGNAYFKLLDTTNLTVDGNIYVKVPQSEFLNVPSAAAAGMIPNISHAPAFFKVLDPSMITPKSGITQNQVFFKVFDSNPYANKIYVQSPLEQQQLLQQRGEKAVLVEKALGEAELQQLRQSIKVLDRDMLIDQPTLGAATATRVLYQTNPLSPLQQQQQPIQIIETCPTSYLTTTQQQGNVVFLNQGMDKQWFTIPAGQAYSSEHGNLRLKIAIDPAEALNKQLIHQQQQQGEWIAVNPARHQGTMFLNITVENPLRSRL